MQIHHVDAGKRFRIVRNLGEGATCQVFEVEDVLGGGRFALKRLRHERISSDRLARFKDEYRAFESLSHPNLAKSYELICDQNGAYLLMELVEGVDFLRYVGPVAHAVDGMTFVSGDTGSEGRARTTLSRTRACPSIDTLRAALRQLASGLMALHAAGTIHCDIKPENILVTASGRVVVLDFGLAASSRSRRAARGTPAFMAPEQFVGEVSEATDWYAVGVLLYASLTGRLPVAGSSRTLAHAKRFGRALDPRVYVAGLPDDLVELALRLLEPEPADRPTGVDVAFALGLPVDSADIGQRSPQCFVGRTRELDQLDAALKQTHQGSIQVAHVRGESGIGKTALVRHFVAGVARGGSVVFRGACYRDVSVPFNGLDSIMDAIATYLVDAEIAIGDDTRTALATMFPVFDAQAATRHADPAVEPAVLRRKWLQAFESLIFTLGSRRPVVIWIDDLQWTDAESIDLLLDFLRATAPLKLLVILGYRWAANEAESTHYARKRLPIHVDLQLSSFDDETMRALVEASGVRSLRETETIVRESGGSPFFAGELLRAKSAWSAQRSVSLEGVLASRWNDLPREHRTYLEVVLVAGRPVHATVVQGALGLAQDEALKLRSTLLAQSFLRAAGRGTIQPYHDRIRENLLLCITDDVARAHHDRLATVLASTGDVEPDVLAFHYRAAGNIPMARAYTKQAADTAAQALAFDRASSLYATTLEWTTGAAREKLLLKYAQSLSNAGRPSEAAGAFSGALMLRPGDIELQLCAGDELLRAGKVEAGFAFLTKVADSIQEPFPRNPLRTKVALIWKGRRLRKMRVVLREDAAPELQRRLALCLTLARRLVLVDYGLAALFQLRHLELALSAGSRVEIAQGLALQACYSAVMPPFVAGGVPCAKALVSQAEALVRPSDEPLTRACVLFAPGAIALGEGRWRDARRAFENVIDILHEKASIGLQWYTTFAQSIITEMLQIEGNVAELRRRLHGYLRESKGHLMAESTIVLKGGVLLALCDDAPDEARRIASEVMSPWPEAPWRMPHHFHCVALHEIDLYEGNPKPALKRLRESRTQARRAGLHDHSLYWLMHTILHVRLELSAGRHRSARHRIRFLERQEHGWAAAIGTALHGCLLAAMANKREAIRRFETAVERLGHWDLDLFAVSARFHLGRLTDNHLLETEALQYLNSCGVVAPQRMISSLLPVTT
jgi:tRNA A-37 threonylcarbamoyl transferase component Bud32